MNQAEAFKKALWISSQEENKKESFVIRRRFVAGKTVRAKIRFIGFGTSELFINGKRASEDLFLPLASEYEYSGEPKGEEVGYRTYFNEYDITELIEEGENTLAVHLGYGWYTGIVLWNRLQKVHGEKKLIYVITLENSDGEEIEYFSDGSEIYKETFVKSGNLHNGEVQDLSGFDESVFAKSCDESDFSPVRFSTPVNTEFYKAECPADRVCERLGFKVVKKGEGYTVYDAGRNLSGYPCLRSLGAGEVTLTFSELLLEDGELDPTRVHDQKMSYKVDRAGVLLYPRFTWFAFRYFMVVGNAEPTEVKVVHSDVKVDSSFVSNDETLNWIYEAFVHTQENNMHRGIPSDCPHIERLGYTGDGQLACRASLLSFDGETFYRKWIGDILDCQDKKTGHVQYTAPYVNAGGGPGGWGIAIVTVPYEFYKMYNDVALVSEAYPYMKKYIEFLRAHSELGLVMSDLPGKWCLGDWCTPPGNCCLPAPYVNTYFHVLALMRMKELAAVIGMEADIPAFDAEIEECKAAMKKFYCNDFGRDASYAGNTHGANAFALHIGLASEIAAAKFVEYYEYIGHYDTGIFGTDLVTRMLFELGEADLAVRLLTASEPHGFGKWMQMGHTTLPEYFTCQRSLDHPMFGAVVSTFFDYILGIGQKEGTAGYTDIVIAPKKIAALNNVSGHITVKQGKIAVSYCDTDGARRYRIEIPEGSTATVRVDGIPEFTVGAGVHEF